MADSEKRPEHRKEVTRLLREVAAASDTGAPAAGAALIRAVYDELRVIARNRLNRERPGHTLQATALVSEAYMQLFGGKKIHFNDRAHFFAAAADAMRRILLDHARRRGRQKRGGGRQRISLDVIDLADSADGGDILAVDEAIQRLKEQDPDLAEVVKLRFFAGLSCEEAADVLGSSERTVRRDWKLAEAWLARELDREETG